VSEPELAKAYAPADVERKWYAFWEERGLFHASPDPSRTPYTVVIPPPNITGVLHMGHILNNSIQDMVVRYRRMEGREACWIPGTDHAGIATQNVVEKSLMKEGKTRHDLGREEFVRRVWAWKEQYGGTIIRQLRTLGSSCDWEREKFTMDETLSEAVKEVFVRLYEDGLIYRGTYIVNWCPKDHTAISDDEVEYADQQGKLWYLRYPVEGAAAADGSPLHAVVATTRPETMFGDTAVAVNPKDERYRHLIGRTVRLPLADRSIPIIADEHVDPAFGTGMVKITPAHDPNDYWVGQRHGLPQLNVFDVSAALNENAPASYRGLDRFEARKKALAELEAAGLLDRVEEHRNAVGRCYRCGTVIEPYLSDQWFVRMEPLAGPALQAVMDGHIRFHPDRWVKVYHHWMTTIRDWCISRQLWWGHRIPVWYCGTAGCTDPIVRRTPPERCPRCGGTALRQDEDVLDTWFSSWLWPFSVHDWPQQEKTGRTGDLKYFYPTHTLVTAPEIIFFWVARMIMAGLKFGPSFTGSTRPEENVPFRDVYFTSIVRDLQGRKMSKSLGNSPEPLDLIAEYGADAVRFTTLYLAPLGQDVLYAAEKNEIGRNFANKIWNAGRLLMMNRAQTGEAERNGEFLLDHLDLADRWILSRLHGATEEIRAQMDAFEVNKCAKAIYDFVWHDFADWYLELIKSRLYADEPTEVKRAVITRALDVFDAALRLLHPLMPFITEELWQAIRVRPDGASIMRAPLPHPGDSLRDQEVERQMAFVQNVIEAVRTIRGEMAIPPSREIRVVMNLSGNRSAEQLRPYEGYLRRLARVTALEFVTTGPRPPHSATAVVQGDEIFVPLEGLIDLDLERARLRKEIDRLAGVLEGIRKKLGNESFVGRAPAEVVEKEREKQRTFETNLEKLRGNLAALS
jgi:valyl-tRNA synthetase